MGQAKRPDRSGARLMQRQCALFYGRAGSHDIIDKQNMTVANFFRRVAIKRAVYIFLSPLAVQFPLRRSMPTADQSVVFPLHPLRLAPCRKYQFDLIVAALFAAQRRQRNRDRHPASQVQSGQFRLIRQRYQSSQRRRVTAAPLKFQSVQ